jgi:tetratricopeptide (TPR) repeat protein
LRSGVAYWTWVFPAAVAIALMVRRRRPLIAAALLFIAGLLPVLGLATFLFQRYSTVADRFVYLSMFGIAFALAWVISRFSTRPVFIACALILILLGIRSTTQTLTWRNRRTLYGHAVQVSPQSATAHSNWGIVLSAGGDIESAEAEYRRAIQLDPDLLVAHYNLAGILRAQGRMEELERERQIVEQIKAKSPATQPS